LDGSITDLVFGGATAAEGNAVSNNNPNKLGSSFNLFVRLSAGTAAAKLNYSVMNNTFRDAGGAAIEFDKQAGLGDMLGTISNNTVGVSGVPNSGSAQGSGIVTTIIGGGTHTTTVTNNTVYQFTNFGILVQGGGSSIANGGQGYMTAVVQGNTISQPSPNSLLAGFPTIGIRLTVGTNSGDTTKFWLTIGGSGAAKNTVLLTGTNGGTDLRLQQRFNTFLGVNGYAGGTTDATAMQNYLLSQNTAGTALASTSSPNGWSGTQP
ncbi:MAG: hypothetical protein QOH93_75, partial [Chloroflexia bacterium]|nr:hypothetical protein [Chloroflexia bacterium]